VITTYQSVHNHSSTFDVINVFLQDSHILQSAGLRRGLLGGHRSGVIKSGDLSQLLNGLTHGRLVENDWQQLFG